MNNIIISLIISIGITVLMVLSESKKENRKSVGIRSFFASLFVSFIALTYLIDNGFSSQDIETSQPNF
jgi:hypothetical protein